MTDRPKGDDEEALEYMSGLEHLQPIEADFLESLSGWTGNWTEKQAAWFDDLCLKYTGAK